MILFMDIQLFFDLEHLSMRQIVKDYKILGKIPNHMVRQQVILLLQKA